MLGVWRLISIASRSEICRCCAKALRRGRRRPRRGLARLPDAYIGTIDWRSMSAALLGSPRAGTLGTASTPDLSRLRSARARLSMSLFLDSWHFQKAIGRRLVLDWLQTLGTGSSRPKEQVCLPASPSGEKQQMNSEIDESLVLGGRRKSTELCALPIGSIVACWSFQRPAYLRAKDASSSSFLGAGDSWRFPVATAGAGIPCLDFIGRPTFFLVWTRDVSRGRGSVACSVGP